MSSYGHAYLTSYGWTGTGTGLRSGAIVRPLAIPPKKNLGGLGKDRDEAFPFWDHVFAAASKAITIRISSDDEGAEDSSACSHADPLRRTVTGIISNRRPLSDTPAPVSGITTPHPGPDPATNASPTGTDAVGRRLSLRAAVKREAAKCGLYSRFLRGPVLGPDGHDDDCLPSEPERELRPRSPSPMPVREPVGQRNSIAAVAGETRERKLRVNARTKEARRERKRLEREHEAANAAKKARRTLAREEKEKGRLRDGDKETGPEENEKSSCRAQRRARKPPESNSLGRAKGTGDNLDEQLAPLKIKGDDAPRRPSSHVDTADASIAVIAAKKKRRKQKDTTARHASNVTVAS